MLNWVSLSYHGENDSRSPKGTMSDKFDPYHRWLGIRPKHQPPTHYRLLGIDEFEDDPEVIRDAAAQRMAHVRTYQLGPHSEISQKILNELGIAKVCLLDPAKKAEYDELLRKRLAPSKSKLDGFPQVEVFGPAQTELDFTNLKLPSAVSSAVRRPPTPLPLERIEPATTTTETRPVTVEGTIPATPPLGNRFRAAGKSLWGGVAAASRPLDGLLRRLAGEENDILRYFLWVVFALLLFAAGWLTAGRFSAHFIVTVYGRTEAARHNVTDGRGGQIIGRDGNAGECRHLGRQVALFVCRAGPARGDHRPADW